MSPNFNQDDFVVSLGVGKKRYHLNDVVVVKHPRYGRIIKRIVKISDDDQLLLAGDNPESTSSAKLGWVGRESILGKVVMHFRA